MPDEYPIACLLGCVDVVDCLSQEDYRIKVQSYDLLLSFEPFAVSRWRVGHALRLHLRESPRAGCPLPNQGLRINLCT